MDVETSLVGLPALNLAEALPQGGEALGITLSQILQGGREIQCLHKAGEAEGLRGEGAQAQEADPR